MTSETRTLIETADIKGIEIECPECHITTFYPIRLESIRKIGPSCHHCNNQLFDMASVHVAGIDAYPAVASLYQILGNLSKLAEPSRTDIHASIRLLVNLGPQAAK